MFFFHLITGHGRTRFSTSTPESAGTSKPNRLVAWLRDVRAALASPFHKAKDANQKASGTMAENIVSVHGDDTEQTGPTNPSLSRWSIPPTGDMHLKAKGWTLPDLTHTTRESVAVQPPVQCEIGIQAGQREQGTVETQTDRRERCTIGVQTEPPAQDAVETKPRLSSVETQTELSGQTEPDSVVPPQPKANAMPATVATGVPPAPPLAPDLLGAIPKPVIVINKGAQKTKGTEEPKRIPLSNKVVQAQKTQLVKPGTVNRTKYLDGKGGIPVDSQPKKPSELEALLQQRGIHPIDEAGNEPASNEPASNERAR